jgi:polyisoprenoid-binding protein YceI
MTDVGRTMGGTSSWWAEQGAGWRPTRVQILLLLVGVLASTAGACRGPEADDRRATATPESEVPETRLSLAPFQSSAVTLAGEVGARPAAFTFERLTGELALRDGVATRLVLDIDLDSVAASSAALKARMARPDMFGGAARPTARFRSTAIRELAGGGATIELAITGELALAGRVHDVTLRASLARVAGGWVLRSRVPVGEAAWAAAFSAKGEPIFDQRIDLQTRLSFPDPRAPRGAAATALATRGIRP